MRDIYAAVLEVNENGIEKRINKTIDPTSVYRDDGFEFQVLYCEDDFFQLKTYTYNFQTTQLLDASCENCGRRVGGKLNIPILMTTEGGFAGSLCSYVLMLSREPVLWNDLYRLLEIDDKWEFSPNNYQYLEKKLEHFERVYGFAELMNYVGREPEINRMTSEMVERTCIYDENFTSSMQPDKRGNVQFEENLTLRLAKEAVENGKRTAVLSFANPVESGGGVLRGAKAQEENICRSSNLYKALSSEKVRSYYKANKSILSKNQFKSILLGTDQVVYSPDVTVFKENPDYLPGFINDQNESYTDHYFNVDVITAAAPYFSDSGYVLPNGDLQHLLERRIINILEAAIENEVEFLVLGAFGCGNFHNPPNVVADAFRRVLLMPRYRYAFDSVVFAIKRTDTICPNIEAFQRNFTLFPDINYQGSESVHRRCWKWACQCGTENFWDDDKCKKCQGLREHRKFTRV